jgi:SAM-dependent methyltransferase
MTDKITNPLPLSETSEAPFIGYYSRHRIIPVSQNLDDLAFHFARRDYLYRTLGLVPKFLKGSRIIEFGPGTADNAVYTNHLEPEEYWLVDGNPASIDAIKDKIERGLLDKDSCKVIQADFRNYESNRQFDLVICEGCIPGQVNPKAILRNLGKLCLPGGVLLTTTISEVSILSEICRQMFYPAIIREAQTFDEQVALAARIFKPHLDYFQFSIRPVEDWVQDNILHNWFGVKGSELMSISDALAALDDEFQYQSSSPKFLRDYRWYKSVNPNENQNTIALDAYERFQFALLDCRLNGVRAEEVVCQTTPSVSRDLESLCKRIGAIRSEIVANKSYDRLEECIRLLDDVAKLLPNVMFETKEAIEDFILGIRVVAEGNALHRFGAFCNWWGRGQQNISFIKTPMFTKTP